MNAQEQLLAAIRDRDPVAIEEALENGADLNQRDANGKTPMMRIVWECAMSTVLSPAGTSGVADLAGFLYMLCKHGGILTENDRELLRDRAVKMDATGASNRNLWQPDQGSDSTNQPSKGPLERRLTTVLSDLDSAQETFDKHESEQSESALLDALDEVLAAKPPRSQGPLSL